MKILMVDDDVEITKAVEDAVTAAGHDFKYSNDPKEGLKLIRGEVQDMILLDLTMPEFCGIDIINDLAKDGKIKEKKIVVMTASAVADEELDGLVDLGVHSVLKKPVDIDTLLDKIDEVGSS
jgi:DNA-binding response OmpR family regulator